MNLNQFSFYVILLIFVVVHVIVYFGYKKPIKRFQDYLGANQSVGVAPLALAIISMSLSGALLRSSITNVQLYGISTSVANMLFYTITPLILGYVIFPRLLTFPNTYTLGGIIRHMYGPVAAVITSCMTAFIVGYIAYYQLVKLARIAPILHKNQQFFILLVGIVAVLQAIWISNSSISSVAILQFIIVTGLLFSLVTIVLALPVVAENGGGLQGLLEAIKNQATAKKDILLGYRPYRGTLLNFLNPFFLFLLPPLMQRILMLKDSRQVKSAFRGFALFHIFLQFFVAIIGLGAVLVRLKKYGVFPTRFNISFSSLTSAISLSSVTSLSTNGWMSLFYAYLILVCSIGIVSYFLHGLAVELSENVIKPFYTYKGKALRYDNDIIKLIILITGSLCILLALMSTGTHYDTFLPLLIFIRAILVPFLIGCIGLRSNSRIFIIGIITFYITTFMLGWAAHYDYLPIKAGIPFYRQLARIYPFSMLATGIAILIAHYWTYGRWRKRKAPYIALQAKKKQEDSFKTIFNNPLLWAKTKLEKYDHQTTAVGAFLLFTLSFPMLTGNSNFKCYNSTFMFFVRFLGITLATITMLHNLFPYFIKRLFPLLWFLTLGYCIPFCNTFFMMCSPSSPILVARLSLLLILLKVLVDWRTFVILASMGSLSAYGCYKVFVPVGKVLSFAHTWYVVELMVLTGIVIMIFMRYQEEVNANHIKRNKTLASGFSHDLRNLLQYTYWMVDDSSNNESIMQVLQHRRNDIAKDDQLHQSLINTTVLVKKHLKESEKKADVFYQLVENEYIKPKDIKEISIRQLIEASYLFIPSEYEDKVKIVVTQDEKVIVHPTIIRSAIINLVKNAIWHGQAEKVIIGWDHTKKCLYVQDNGLGIPSEKQPYIFDLYYSTGGSGIGLPFIKITLQKTNAAIFYITSSQGTTFFMNLPTAK